MAAGALAAVYDGQDHRLPLAAVALQAEEPDRGVGVQPVAAALAHRLQVRLLSDGRRRSKVRAVQEELDEVANGKQVSNDSMELTKTPTPIVQFSYTRHS